MSEHDSPKSLDQFLRNIQFGRSLCCLRIRIYQTRIHRLISDLKTKNPASIKVATLLFKPEALQLPVKPDYVGFEIPQKFIIGFGLDLDGLARNLNDIYVIKGTD